MTTTDNLVLEGKPWRVWAAERELAMPKKWARRTGMRKKRNPGCQHAADYHEHAKYQVALAKLAVRQAWEHGQKEVP